MRLGESQLLDSLTASGPRAVLNTNRATSNHLYVMPDPRQRKWKHSVIPTGINQ